MAKKIKKLKRKPIAFVLIETEPKYENHVLKELGKLDDVTYSFGLFGEYDIIAQIRGKSYDDAGSIVFDKIRKLDYIKQTTTLGIGDWA